MSVQHFMLSVELPDDEAMDPAAVQRALLALNPAATVRLREGFPKVLVVVPEDREEAVIFSTDARVQLSLVDCREPDGLDAGMLSERLREGIEFGSGPNTHAEREDQAAALIVRIAEAEAEEAGPSFR